MDVMYNYSMLGFVSNYSVHVVNCDLLISLPVETVREGMYCLATYDLI